MQATIAILIGVTRKIGDHVVDLEIAGMGHHSCCTILRRTRGSARDDNRCPSVFAVLGSLTAQATIPDAEDPTSTALRQSVERGRSVDRAPWSPGAQVTCYDQAIGG